MLRPLVVTLTALLAVSLTVVETVDDGGAVSGGTIRAVARVVDARTAREAAAAVSAAAQELEAHLRAHEQALADPSLLQMYLEQFECEQAVGGGTVQIEYLPPSSNEPAILQVEWTSN